MRGEIDGEAEKAGNGERGRTGKTEGVSGKIDKESLDYSRVWEWDFEGGAAFFAATQEKQIYGLHLPAAVSGHGKVVRGKREGRAGGSGF